MDHPTLRRDAAVPAGPVAVAVMAFRYQGALQVSVIAKATFAFAPDAEMTRAPAQEVVRAEIHHGDSPTRSIHLATDLVPYLNRADVIFTGHAHAPGGAPVDAMLARLGVFDGPRAVLDKSVIVRQEGGFRQLPVVYERAYGGPGWTDNPIGVGVIAGSGEPSVVDPLDDKRLAGFGPIGQDWPARRWLLGALPRKALAAEEMAIPDGFDWDYFQSAPPDQRVAYLRGDEWIVMDGLHPSGARFSTRLPGAVGLARLHGLAAFGIPEGQLLELHADVLRIDGDAQQATLTFRGTFPLPSAEALPSLRVAAGVEQPGLPIPWPEADPDDEEFGMATLAILADEDFEIVSSPSFEGTLAIGGITAAVPTTPLPFPSASGRAPLETIDLAGGASAEDASLPFHPALPRQQGPGGTAVQSFDAEALAALRRLPLAGPRTTLEQTLDTQSLAALRSLPFAPPLVATAPAPPAMVTAAPVPLSEPPAAPAEPPLPAAPSPPPDPPPAPRVIAAPEPPPPPAVSRPERPQPRPPPPPGPAAEVRRGLYSRFGAKR